MTEPFRLPAPAALPRIPRWAHVSGVLFSAGVISFGVAWQWRSAGAVHVWFLNWVALTPLIFAAGARWPLKRGRMSRTLMVHLVLAPALILVAHALDIATRLALGFGEQQAEVAGMWDGFRGTVVHFSLIHFGILALQHTLAYRGAYHEEVERKLRTEAELSRAQLRAVQAQLQPHFLFNALNTIASLVGPDPRTAREMIAHLSDLLRVVLRRGTLEQVPLADELRFAESYLEIQRVRFSDRLEVRIDVDPAALECAVPPMVLQPILENAFEHGLPETGSARVQLTARRDGDTTRITVVDNGPGFAGANVVRNHGLASVEALLANQFGTSWRLSLEAPADGTRGAAVVLEMPCRGLTHAEPEQDA